MNRSLVDYLPDWRAAKTAAERCAIAASAAAEGEIGIAAYLADAVTKIHGSDAGRRAERMVEAAS